MEWEPEQESEPEPKRKKTTTEYTPEPEPEQIKKFGSTSTADNNYFKFLTAPHARPTNPTPWPTNPRYRGCLAALQAYKKDILLLKQVALRLFVMHAHKNKRWYVFP